MTGPSLAEMEQVASTFGVGMEQVRRDHLISHVLSAIASDISTDDLVFFGGTALSRTHLGDSRLSEDIDLIARIPCKEIAEKIERAVRRGLARSHGRPTWQPVLTATTGSQPTVLTVPDGTSVQVQLLGGEGVSVAHRGRGNRAALLRRATRSVARTHRRCVRRRQAWSLD